MQVKCPSCGATQNISEGQNCSFCGSVIEIESAKNNYQAALKSETGNLMAMAETAIEATNWEEALQFFNQVLTKDITNSDAWLGKGIAIIYTSKIGALKITEAIAYWKNALKHAPNQEAMGKRVAKEINEVVNKFYPSLENHFIQFKDLDNSFHELVGKFVTLEKAQDYATQLDPQNINYYETGYLLCERVINIPIKYALSDISAAWAQGIMGALQDNKYKQQDAIQQRRRAKSREIEIKEAGFIVNEIKDRYLIGIRNLKPDYVTPVTSAIQGKTDDRVSKLIIDSFKNFSKNKSSYMARVNTNTEVKKTLGLKQTEADKLVRKVLLENNLISQEDIKKQDRRAMIIVAIIIIVGVILYTVSHNQ